MKLALPSILTGGILTGFLLTTLSGGVAVTMSGCDSGSSSAPVVLDPSKEPGRDAQMERMKAFYAEKAAKGKKKK